MKNIEIKCDSCSMDLSSTTNCVDYRLSLVNDSLPSRSNVVTSMMIYPPIDRDAHFCGINCLKKWLSSKYPDVPKEQQSL